MKTRIIIFSLVIALIVLIAPVQVNCQDVGSSAPDFTLSTDVGGSFHLFSQQGKVVFIFFFGYACPHCLANGNNTQTGIYEIYKDNSDFVAVGVDTWDGNGAGVENFKSSTGLTYPLCYQGSELESLYSISYDRMVVIDKEGIIRYKSHANSISSVVEAASNVISSLLNATSVADVYQGDNPSLLVYPNPAVDQIHIKPSQLNDGKATIYIRNTSGQVVATKQIRHISADKDISMPVGLLPAGIYLLQYLTNSKEESVKLVVE